MHWANTRAPLRVRPLQQRAARWPLTVRTPCCAVLRCALQDELASLHGANRQLAARLEAQQQRMELLSQQLSLQHAAQHAQQQQQPVVNGVAIGMPPGANGRAQPPAAKGGWAAGTHAVAVARRPGLHYLS